MNKSSMQQNHYATGAGEHQAAGASGGSTQRQQVVVMERMGHTRQIPGGTELNARINLRVLTSRKPKRKHGK